MTFISEIKNKIRRTGMRNIYHVFQPPASQFLQRVYYDLWRLLHFKWKKNPTLPVHHIYVLLDLQYMIVADIILSRVMTKTWLRCVRRITTQICLRICTVYSNKRFFVSCFDSSACNNGSYVKKLRYVSSLCPNAVYCSMTWPISVPLDV